LYLSDLKIGDLVYYQATEEDIKNTYENIHDVGFGLVSGGLDEPNVYHGITPLGSYLRNVYNMMNRSKNKKVQVQITCLIPIKVEPLLIYQRDNNLLYFPY
jgi:hypothetical protein